MVRRASLVQHLSDLVGREVLQVVDPRDGWPALVQLRIGGTFVPASLHVGPIGLSHRGRDAIERRFQNPGKGKEVRALSGAAPLLLGLWEEREQPVVVAMDAEHRLGKATRQSMFIPLATLEDAASRGWSEHVNTAQERITAFHPALLPTYVEAQSQNAVLPSAEMARIVEAADLLAEGDVPAAERARRAASRLVRSSAFRRRVVEAYGGRCAMCGLNFGLVEAAHVYPAGAVGSPDSVWNGIALCGNHHAAFDRHLLWVEPQERSVIVHPSIRERAHGDAAARSFLECTGPRLREPQTAAQRPRPEMFRRRYALFEEHYAWAG